MSFSASIPVTAREDFDAVVAGMSLPEGASTESRALFESGKQQARASAHALGPENTYISGSISGHACDENDSSSFPYDSLNVSVSGTTPPPDAPAPVEPEPEPAPEPEPTPEG